MTCLRERRCAAVRIAAVLLLLGPSVTGWAQDAYPSRPVRLVVPFPPGGSTDNLARVVVPRLIPILQQQVIIDNRGGAASNIGTDLVAKAAPDGYTVGLFDTAFVINPTLYAKLPFDPLRDFRAVMVVAAGPSVLVVHPSLGVFTVKELVALAKAKPGALTFASAGAGTAIHLLGEMLKAAAGIDLLHVPYKGAGPAITDVVAGQVHMMFAQPGTVLGQVSANRMRAIAMNGDQRWSGMPNVPTFAEGGVPGMEVSSVWQVMVPAATPAAVIAVLHSALQRAIAAPEIRDRLAELCYFIVAADPEKSAAIIRGDIEKWGRAVKASGARAE